MDGYGYPYGAGYPSVPQEVGDYSGYPDRGDGVADYYSPRMNDNRKASHSKHHVRKHRSRSQTVTKSWSQSRSQTQSRSRSLSRSKSRSKSRSRSGSKSRSLSRSRKDLKMREPSFLDAFRVMYLTPSKHKKSTTKYLSTKKRQDRVHEMLKLDRLGSKHWYMYPRNHVQSEQTAEGNVPGSRDNCDQRIKIDGDFFRKCKRNKKIDAESPIAKLKRWELIFYKKLGFIQAV